jgi:hypothetical protein
MEAGGKVVDILGLVEFGQGCGVVLNLSTPGSEFGGHFLL